MTNKMTETIEVMFDFKNTLVEYANEYIRTNNLETRARVARYMMQEIDVYRAAVDTTVGRHLQALKDYLGGCHFHIQEYGNNVINRITTAYEAVCENITDKRPETAFSLSVLKRDGLNLLDSLCHSYSIDDIDRADMFRSDLRRFIKDYAKTYARNNESYLLGDAWDELCYNNLGRCRDNLAEYIDRRLEALNEIAQPEPETIDGVRKLYDRVTFLLSKRVGREYVEYALIDSIERYIRAYGENDDTKYLNAIIYIIRENPIEDVDEFVESDIKNYRESRLLDIAERQGIKMLRCEHCNELLPESETKLGVDDEVCCNKCFFERYFICEGCEQVFSKDTPHRTTAEGNPICEECFEDEYFICDDCHEIYHKDDRNYIEHYDRDVCDTCFDENYSRCEGCDMIIAHDDIDARYVEYDGYYCQECYDERYTPCAYCGDDVPLDEVHYVEGTGDVCHRCYEEKFSVIHEYHDDEVDFDLLAVPDEPIGCDTLTIGIEHEVGYTRRDVQERGRKLLEIVNERCDNIVLFRDGSVDGFEIVSMPMTIRYFYEMFLPMYKKGLDYMIKQGFEGADAGGIHIHFSRLKDSMEVARMCNILYGDRDSKNAWLKITDRKEGELDHWSSMSNRRYSTVEILQKGYDTCTTDRYTALNCDCDRTDTHELRIYNSTLEYDKYVSYVESALALIAFVKEDIGRGAYVTTYDYLSYIKEHRDVYPKAFKVFTDKDIFEDYGLESEQIPLNLNLDVELSPEAEQEISDMVNSIFSNVDSNEQAAVG